MGFQKNSTVGFITTQKIIIGLIFVVLLTGSLGLWLKYVGKVNQNQSVSIQPKVLLESDAGVLSASADSDFKESISFLTKNLATWDPKFIIDGISLKFGSQPLKPTTHVTIYSGIYKIYRYYDGKASNLNRLKMDTDMSEYGQMYKNLPMSNYIPKSPKNAVEKCVEYAVNMGKYYLDECSNYATEYLSSRDWICTFKGDNNKPTRLCFFDSGTNKVKSWEQELPTPMQ